MLLPRRAKLPSHRDLPAGSFQHPKQETLTYFQLCLYTSLLISVVLRGRGPNDHSLIIIWRIAIASWKALPPAEPFLSVSAKVISHPTHSAHSTHPELLERLLEALHRRPSAVTFRSRGEPFPLIPVQFPWLLLRFPPSHTEPHSVSASKVPFLHETLSQQLRKILGLY